MQNAKVFISRTKSTQGTLRNINNQYPVTYPISKHNQIKSTILRSITYQSLRQPVKEEKSGMSQTGGGQTTQCFGPQCARRTQSVGAGGLAAGVELQVQVPLPLPWGYREYMYRRPAFNLLCWQPDEWCSPQTPHFQYNISKLPMRSTSRPHGSPAKVYPATVGASQFAVPFPLISRDFF